MNPNYTAVTDIRIPSKEVCSLAVIFFRKDSPSWIYLVLYYWNLRFVCVHILLVLSYLQHLICSYEETFVAIWFAYSVLILYRAALHTSKLL
jgi:hypothetical protein